MRRQRRNRSVRRRGVQHVGGLLASIIAEIDQDEAAEVNLQEVGESQHAAVTVGVDSQFTFSFYQTAEV